MTYKEILMKVLPKANNFALSMLIENTCPDDVFGTSISCPYGAKCDGEYCWNRRCRQANLKGIFGNK